ncbi:LacI family DNA-binding transcriptional regulator [Spirillospora sp. CA-255316]
MPPKRVTQADVARLAGVSQATVSLVLNAEDERVGAETRQRVLDAITRTGYSANPVAQRLARGRNHILGVFTYEPVFPSTSADFYYPFLVGIETEAERVGCDLLLFTSAPVEGGRRRLSAKARAHLRVTDGCVLLGHEEDKADLVHLINDGLPVVFVGRRELPGTADLPYVGADYVSATRDVVRLFLDRGHRRVGFVGETSGRESLLDRVAGYRTTMREAGLRPVAFDSAELTAAEIVDLATDNRLTGLVLAEGHRAEDIRAAAAARGLAIPSDLSVAILGPPEVPITQSLAWTGFRIPRGDMGRQAVALLTDLIAGTAGERHRLLPCATEPGETVTTPPTP